MKHPVQLGAADKKVLAEGLDAEGAVTKIAVDVGDDIGYLSTGLLPNGLHLGKGLPQFRQQHRQIGLHVGRVLVVGVHFFHIGQPTGVGKERCRIAVKAAQGTLIQKILQNGPLPFREHISAEMDHGPVIGDDPIDPQGVGLRPFHDQNIPGL